MSKFFVTCARGVEEITEAELKAVGAGATERVPGGVYFEGDQDTLYRAHLWLRTGNRILLPLRSFPCHCPEDLYEAVAKFKWETFFPRPTLTFAVECTLSGQNDPRLNHSHYARLKAKDAIVDRLREKTGSRPDVDVADPDLRAVIYVRDGVATLNMDATGASLHERGYRPADAPAPLKETLAAALLQLAGWDPASRFVDPMCGSGTLLAEAALMATNTAPGLFRSRFLFMNWPDFYGPRWDKWRAEAEAARRPLIAGQICGYDEDAAAIRLSRATLKAIGVGNEVTVERCTFADFQRPEGEGTGLLLLNPPYGERLGDEEALVPLYRSMGDLFKKQFAGWKAGVFTGSSMLAKSIGLKPARRFPLWNGAIECRLLTFDLYAGSRAGAKKPS